jgi:predicted dehydrogenase/threonine dehydrogenase-like Zn-dependent dehydrogenase
MRQVLQHVRGGETEVAEVPRPACRRGGVLVRNQASLISAGTERMVVEFARRSLVGKARERPDLVRQVLDKVRRDGLISTAQTVFARLDEPIPLGYSCAGAVTEIGDGAGEFAVGERVACAGMGYASHAEYVFVPKNLVVAIPDAVSLEDASYVTVGAIALQGCRVADARMGELVAVIGLGLIGQLTVQLLVASGCRVVGVDPDSAKCRLATSGGAIACATSDEEALAVVAIQSAGAGADAIIVCAASESSGPMELAGALARDRAVVSVVGAVKMEMSRKVYYEKELTVRLSRSYGPGRYDPEYEERGIDYPIGYVRWTERRNMEEFIRLVAQGKVRPADLTTHRWQIAQAADAYKLLTSATSERVGGIIITYDDAGSPTPSSARIEVASQPTRPGAARGLGVIGAGAFARAVLLPRISRRKELTLEGIVTTRGATALSAARRFKAGWADTDAARLLADAKIGTVLIATRHGSHASLIVKALEAGKSVFVEKPLATDEGGLQNIEAALRGHPLPVMVGFNRRFSSHASFVRDAIGATTMSLSYRVNAGALPAGNWQSDATDGGGRIVGEVCHFIDLMQYLTGDSPISVSALRPSANALDDSAIITIQFAGGSVGSLVYAAGGDRSYPKERVEVIGGGVVAVIDDFRRSTVSSGGRRRTHKTWRQDKGFDAEVDALVAMATGSAQSPVPFESLALTTRTTFAIERSLRSGQRESVQAPR